MTTQHPPLPYVQYHEKYRGPDWNVIFLVSLVAAILLGCVAYHFGSPVVGSLAAIAGILALFSAEEC